MVEGDVKRTASRRGDCVTIETRAGILTGTVVAASVEDIALHVPDQRVTHVISRSAITSMTSSKAGEQAANAEGATTSPAL